MSAHPSNHPSLSPALVERVLDGLGFSAAPTPVPGSLAALYHAWCQKIPFDNVHKLIYLRAGSTGPLPGDDPSEVLEAWLEHGTGATCWGASGALQALLRSLGFRALAVLATLVLRPDLPPNHGTTVVEFDDEKFLVDTSLLHGSPLPLHEDRPTAIDHPAWALPARFEDGHHWFYARPFTRPSGIDCRLDVIGAPREQVCERHEATRAWGPFNYELSVRTNRGDRVIGTSWGKRMENDADGTLHERPFEKDERAAWLVEEVGLSEEIVSRLPADVPTPPPQSARTATRSRSGADSA